LRVMHRPFVSSAWSLFCTSSASSVMKWSTSLSYNTKANERNTVMFSLKIIQLIPKLSKNSKHWETMPP